MVENKKNNWIVYVLVVVAIIGLLNWCDSQEAKAEPTKTNIVRESSKDDCPGGCRYPQEGCSIKGNISMEGEKIYHMPGQEYYNETKINPEYGERWFCTESEAIKNGWRKALW